MTGSPDHSGPQGTGWGLGLARSLWQERGGGGGLGGPRGGSFGCNRAALMAVAGGGLPSEAAVGSEVQSADVA